MSKTECRLTVFFEDPFWTGVFERCEDGRLSAARVVFGSEPKDYEIYEFILRHFGDLKFSPAVTEEVKETKRNPKRMQREAKKQMLETGIGTRSQQAIKLQHEQNKKLRQSISREAREAEKDRRFLQKQEQRREKHKGH